MTSRLFYRMFQVSRCHLIPRASVRPWASLGHLRSGLEERSGLGGTGGSCTALQVEETEEEERRNLVYLQGEQEEMEGRQEFFEMVRKQQSLWQTEKEVGEVEEECGAIMFVDLERRVSEEDLERRVPEEDLSPAFHQYLASQFSGPHRWVETFTDECRCPHSLLDFILTLTRSSSSLWLSFPTSSSPAEEEDLIVKQRQRCRSACLP